MEARVYLVKNVRGKLLANASIQVKGIVIKGFKVVEGKDSNFVSFPQTKGQDGKYYDQVYALDKDTRRDIENAILDAYDEEIRKERRGRR